MVYDSRTNGIRLALFLIEFIVFGGRGTNRAWDDNPEFGLEFLYTFIDEGPSGPFASSLDVSFRATVISPVNFTNQRWFVVCPEVQDRFEPRLLDDKGTISERVSFFAIQMDDECFCLLDDLVVRRLLLLLLLVFSFVHLGTTRSDFCVCHDALAVFVVVLVETNRREFCGDRQFGCLWQGITT